MLWTISSTRSKFRQPKTPVRTETRRPRLVTKEVLDQRSHGLDRRCRHESSDRRREHLQTTTPRRRRSRKRQSRAGEAGVAARGARYAEKSPDKNMEGQTGWNQRASTIVSGASWPGTIA